MGVGPVRGELSRGKAGQEEGERGQYVTLRQGKAKSKSTKGDQGKGSVPKSKGRS